MSQSTPSKQAKYSDSDNEFLPGDFDNKRTPSSGLKLTQHGDEYQLLLLCLCLWRVLKNKISDFLLATELPEAEKFDDVVVKYKHENRLVLRFLQAKHKEAPRPTDSIHKITLTDLLTPDEGKEFSLLKYFRSFVKILEKRSQNPVPAFLVGGDIQDFILSTNVDLTEEVEEYFEVDDEDPLEKDKVFGVPTEQPKKFKIKESDNELTRQLGVLLYTYSDFDELVEKLADCLLLQQRFDGTSWIFKEYYYPLVKHVLEFTKGQSKGNKNCAKLSDNFKGANSQRTDEVEDFREALMKEIAFRRSDYKILVNISTSTGSSSSPQSNTNRKRKTSTDDSQLTKELKEFVDQLKVAMYPATSNPPNGTGLTPALFKDMTLFKEVVDDKKGKFCDDFVNNPKKLSPKAKLLRKMLIDEVIDGDLADDEFDKVSGATFPTTEGYATRFQPKSNVEIGDVEGFAKDIADLIDKCTGNTIEITDVVGTEQFRKNIIEVAGHVIVKVSSWFEFSGSFIRDRRGRSLAKGLMKFQEALRKRLGKAKFDSVDEYSLNIKLKGFTSCEEAMLRRTLPSPVTKESIEDFYENFRLIVNYPNRYGLRQLLEAEVKAKYQNLNSKAFVDSFVQEVYQWMTQRLGSFYTPKKVETLLARLDKDLSCYELDGINQSFHLALPTKYKFECEDLMTSIKDFLQQTHSRILLLRVENLTLCRVRFMQAFWSLQEENQDASGKLPFYLRRFGYLFMTIEHFLDESFSEKLSKRNQDKDQWNLRVVECWTENLPEAERFGSMLDLLFESSISSSVERRVIFIVKEDMSGKLESALDSYLTQGRNANFKFSSFELKTTFSQLQAPSQDELLENGQVKLNGDNCKLGDIVNQDTADLIDETTLTKLISERDDDIGLVCVGGVTQLFQRTYNLDCYLKRYIQQKGLVDTDFGVEISQEAFLEFVKDEKIVILHGIPGAGKSMLLASFFIQMRDSSQPLWKIHINLNLYTDFFSKKQAEAASRVDRIMSSSECSDFLLELLQSNEDTKLKTQFEINLLRSAFQSEITGKVRLVLFLDGFDEISPNYKDIVLGFLLSSNTCSGALQMFITTRPNFRSYLEENLQTFGFEMRDLTRDEQNQLLMSLIKKLNIQIRDEEVLALMEQFCKALPGSRAPMDMFDEMIFSRGDGMFSAVPLHIAMFAEVCANSDRERIRKCIKTRDLSTFYEMYVERKYQLYREEKMRLNPTNVSSMEESQYAFEGFLKKHMNLALWLIYSKETIMEIVSSFKEYEQEVLSLMEDIKAGKFKYGIVFGVSDRVPQFAHRTFAEYLVARFIISQITSGKVWKSSFLDFFIEELAISTASHMSTFCDGMMKEIDWSCCHFENVDPSYVIDGLLNSYAQEIWGLFTFFAEIFKSCCPHDVWVEQLEEELSFRALSDAEFEAILASDSVDEPCTWGDVFETLMKKCYRDKECFLLYRLLLKWRPESVHRSADALAPLGAPDKIRWKEKRLSDPDCGGVFYIVTSNVRRKRRAFKFLPNWLIEKEDYQFDPVDDSGQSDAAQIPQNG